MKPSSTLSSDVAIPARATIGARRRFAIHHRDGFACQFCGGKPGNDRLHLDHVIPHSFRGSDHDNNLATACERCNLGKAARIAVPPGWCEETLRDDGFRGWKRWERWSLLWTPESAIVSLDDSIWEWISISRVHDSHLIEHLAVKYDRDRWTRNGASGLDGFFEAICFARSLIVPRSGA